MDAQTQVLTDAVELLHNLLSEWTKSGIDSMRKDIRRSYVNRHAWNIHDIAADVLLLAESGRLGSILLLSRPLLESHFKLAAAVAKKEFAAQKVVAEIEDESAKVSKWRAIASPGWIATLDELKRQLDEFGSELRTRYGVTGKHKWNTADVAKEGKLEASYVRDYFQGSKHVHATLSALTEREDGLYIPEALYRLTVSVIEASVRVNQAVLDMDGRASIDLVNRAIELQQEAHAALDLAQSKLTEKIKMPGC